MVMDFMDNEGNLNILNDEQQTPLAMGSFSLIKKMGLEKGIARFSSNGDAFHPQNSQEGQNDNNQLMRYAMSVDNNAIFWKTYKKNLPQKIQFIYEKNENYENTTEQSDQHIEQEISRVNE